LLSSLHCSTLLFMLFGSHLCFYFPFCLAWFFFSHCSLLQLFSYFRYKVFHVHVFLFALLLLVCCYLLKNLVLPPCIPSCKNREWLKVENKKPIFFQ
jgi:hypothetical protein